MEGVETNIKTEKSEPLKLTENDIKWNEIKLLNNEKTISQLHELLLNGYIPMRIELYDSIDIFDVIFVDYKLNFTECIKIADNILKIHPKLLLEIVKRENYNMDPNNFIIISTSIKKLYIYTKLNSTQINQQDEKGLTLMHHIIKNIPDMSPIDASSLLSLIENINGLKMDIKDKCGNTCLHYLAWSLVYCKKTTSIMVNSIIKLAMKLKTDFDVLDAKGRAFIHYVARSIYNFPYGRETNMLPFIIDDLKGINLNVVSKSCTTALSYSIMYSCIDNATCLIKNNVDTNLCKYEDITNEEKSPTQTLNMLYEKIEKHKSRRMSDMELILFDRYINKLDKLKCLLNQKKNHLNN